MLLLVIGLIVFLGVHSLSIVAPGWRAVQLAQRGAVAWKALMAVASLVGFVLLVYGYGIARQAPLVLYTPPTALRHFALLLMLPVFPLLLAAYLPGRIRSAARHPMVLATKLWATAHLLANGTLADLLLFGGFLAWAVADRISLKRRPLPASSAAHSSTAPDARRATVNDIISLAGGLAIYAVFLLWLHLWLIGVSPLG